MDVPDFRAQEEREAWQSAKSSGKHNRDIHQKCGAGAPFDTAEQSLCPNRAQLQLQPGGKGVVENGALNFAEVRAAALRNRNHNGWNTEGKNLISGDYGTAFKNNVGIPAKQRSAAEMPNALPQAQVMMKFEGVKHSLSSDAQKAYYNARAMAEASRERNATQLVLG